MTCSKMIVSQNIQLVSSLYKSYTVVIHTEVNINIASSILFMYILFVECRCLHLQISGYNFNCKLENFKFAVENSLPIYCMYICTQLHSQLAMYVVTSLFIIIIIATVATFVGMKNQFTVQLLVAPSVIVFKTLLWNIVYDCQQRLLADDLLLKMLTLLCI